MVLLSERTSRVILLLRLLGITALLNGSGVEARIRRYKWEVKYEYRSPDCLKKLAITINGQTPGPTIRAQQNDTIIVELTNSLLTENVAIHWHGIRQPGTYLYHAHYGMQRAAGLYGSIIVALPDGQSEPFTYDYDRNIILNDWYHKSTYEQAAGLSSIPFQWVEEPQSLLIHGRGRFNCSSLTTPTLDPGVCNARNPDCSPFRLIVVPGKTYRLRIASLTSLSALGFQIEVEPFVVQNLFIYSGETYLVIVKADQDPTRNYWITSNIDSRPALKTPPGLGIFSYYPNHPRRSPPTIPPAAPVWNDTRPRIAQSQAIKARQGYIHTPPSLSDRVIVFLNTQNTINGNVRWSVNNVSFTLPHRPYLIALNQNLTHAFDQNPPPDGYDFVNYDIFKAQENKNATSSNGIYRLNFNSTVDIILQNANAMKENNSETHPWHLHGHDFWVLGYGEGKFDKFNDPKKYNLVNPIMKNTVPVHPYGWTALRFKADNPGAIPLPYRIPFLYGYGRGICRRD
ncbi:hypothetical protein CRYUN_Cryun17cG0089300 [Craigia yunnanensis]